MKLRNNESGRLHWRLLAALCMGAIVLAGSLYGLRKWRRTYMATQALDRGLTAYAQRQWEEAADGMGRYCSLHPSDLAVLLKYADARLHIQPQKESNVRQAIAAYRQVLRQDPGDKEASERVSQIYLAAGLPGEAEMILRRRLESAADDEEARRLLAMSLASQGRFRQSVVELTTLIEDAPGAVGAYELLASLARERPEEVAVAPLEILRLAVERNPSSAGARVALAFHLAATADTDEKKEQVKAELLQATLCADSSPGTLVRLAAGLAAAGEMKTAEGQLDEAEQGDPYLLSIWTTRASIAMSEGNQEKCGTLALRAIDTLKGEAFYFLPTAFALFLRADDEQAAEDCIGKIETLEPGSPQIPFLRGLLARGRGQYYQAIRYWKASAQEQATQYNSCLQLAEAYREVGDLPAAVLVLESVVSMNPRDAAARLALASALLRSGKPGRAAEHSAAAATLMPRDLSARVLDLGVRLQLAGSSADNETILSIKQEMQHLREANIEDARLTIIEAQLAYLGTGEQGISTAIEILASDEATAFHAEMLRLDLLRRQGEQEAAVEMALRLLDENGENPEAVLAIAQILATSGERAAAVDALRSFAEASEGLQRRRAQLALAALYQRTGSPEESIRTLEQVIAQWPEDVMAQRLLLQRAVVSQDYERAEALVEQIRRIEGEDSRHWRYERAKLLLAQGDWQPHFDEISNMLSRNIEVDPRDIESQVLLGRLQEVSGNTRLAAETYRRAYETDPWAMYPAFSLISVLQALGELEEAARILDDVAQRDMSFGVLHYLELEQRLKEGRIEMAAVTAEEILAADPENSRLRVFVAALRTRRDDFEGAHAILDKMDVSEPSVAAALVELLLREEKTDEALALCDTLVAADDSARTRSFRGRALALVGRLDEALADYEAAVGMEPEDPQWLLALSEFHEACGARTEAGEAALRALQLKDDHLPAIIKAAHLSLSARDPILINRGRDILESGLIRYPDNVELLTLKARLLGAAGDSDSLKEAHRIIERITMENPGRVEAWILYAMIALREGLPESSLEAISRGLSARPTAEHRRELLLLKATVEDMRWPSLALLTLEGLWDEDPGDPAIAMHLARACAKAGQHSKALAVLAEAAGSAQGAEPLGLQLARAEVFASMGDFENALAAANTARAMDSENALAVLAVVRFGARSGDWADAQSAIGDWMREHPEDVRGPLAAAEMLGSLQWRIGLGNGAGQSDGEKAAELALQILETVVLNNPDETGAILALASVCQARGLAARALQLYEQVLADYPDNIIVLNNLAWLLAHDFADYARALKLADRATELYPDFAALLDTRGYILSGQGRVEEARADFERCISLARDGSTAFVSAKLHLAQLLADHRETREAAELLDELLSDPAALSQMSPDDRAEAKRLHERLAVLLPR